MLLLFLQSIAVDPLFYASEANVFDRYANLSAVCDRFIAGEAGNWSTLVSDTQPFATFRNGQASRRLCQIAAARIAWGTPCYAQTWHHCVEHEDPALNVFPPQNPRCEWSLPTSEHSPFAHECTSGRSPLHDAPTNAGMNASCDSAETCRLYQHPDIPYMATCPFCVTPIDVSYTGYPTIDAVRFNLFNSIYD